MNHLFTKLQQFKVSIQPRLKRLWYAPILVIAMGLMFIRLLVFARLLDPDDYALYSAGLLVSGSFLMLGCLGLNSLLQRELPMMIVRGRETAGGVMLLQCVLVALICASLGILIVLISRVPLAGLSPVQIVLSLMHGLSLQLFLVASVESRSRSETMRFANQNLSRAVVMLLTGSVVAALGGEAASVLAAEAVSSLTLFIIILRQQLKFISLSLSAATILAWRRLSFISWRAAMTLLGVSSISFFLFNADRWIAAEKLSTTAFGQYAFAWIVLIVAQSVQLVISASIFPLLARVFAINGLQSSFIMCAKVSLSTFFLGALLLLPLWLILNYSIEKWFVLYAASRSFLPIFLVVAVFRMSDFWSCYLVVIGRETQLLVLNLLSVTIAAFAWWLFVMPKEGALDASQIAVFSLFLAVIGYTFTVFTAWYYSWALRGKDL